VHRLQMGIVEATQPEERPWGRVPQGAFQRLEPDEAKVSRPVPRGGGGGNTAPLPDTGATKHETGLKKKSHKLFQLRPNAVRSWQRSRSTD
jgi:hypothetical protein